MSTSRKRLEFDFNLTSKTEEGTKVILVTTSPLFPTTSLLKNHPQFIDDVQEFVLNFVISTTNSLLIMSVVYILVNKN